MNKLVVAARLGLQTQEAAAPSLRARDAFAEAAQSLRQHERQLGKAYPAALLKVFSAVEGASRVPSAVPAGVHFDQLELMDDAQMHCAVTLARMRHDAGDACGADLAELQRLVHALQGLQDMPPEATALRLDSYVQALQEAVEKTQVSPAIQAIWYQAMSATLGQELKTLYSTLAAKLRHTGLAANARTVTHTSGRAGTAQPGTTQAGPMHPRSDGTRPGTPGPKSAAQGPALLTLDRLRKLLSGALDEAPTGNRVQQFAAQFSQAFEAQEPEVSPDAAEFESTVPAALEALTEMNQVEQVVRSLERRRSGAPSPKGAGLDVQEGQRQASRRNAKDVAQALSVEVVLLMVDNMAQDPRLLDPVRQVIRSLEPSLLRLALADPRFFTDKQHPARQLLQAITHQSLAFASGEAAGFDAFLSGLQSNLEPLRQLDAISAECFAERLDMLQHDWAQSSQSSLKAREAAVEVLRHAEARNLLADKIAASIESHPDTAQVPAVVVDFLCGPWAQVVAQARIKQGAGSELSEKFEALTPALLWSAHPELARANPAKLTRLVPRLLATLREGLETIQYPGTRASAFFESMMAIHEKSFRRSSLAPTPNPVSTQAPVPVPALPTHDVHERLRLLEDGDPWIAPQEAAASNFVDLEADSVSVAPTEAVVDMPLGSWVEMWHNGQWVRTQLTWASPHGTLFLFTGVFGATQSMSRRLRDKLLATDKLRLLSGHAFVDGALDAVAQTAVRNSLDTML